MTYKRITPIIIALFLLAPATSLYSESNIEKARQSELETHASYEKTVEYYLSAIADEPENINKNRFMLGRFYYKYGKYKAAIGQLTDVYSRDRNNEGVVKFLALSYYYSADYTQALSLFEKHKYNKDDEYVYHHAMTCEKQNLYDNALSLHEKIRKKPYKGYAVLRIDAINAKNKKITVDDIEDKQLRNTIKNAPAQEDYPNAGAIILLDEYTFEVLPDSSSVRELHFMVKVLNDRGRGYGEVELDYDSTYEKVEILYARTIKPDGVVVSVGDKHIRDVSRYQNFPLYSNSRVKIISMPEVSDDAIIEYRARWYNNKLIDGRHFSRHFGVQGREPYMNQKINITLPSSFRMNIKEYNPGYAGIKIDYTPSFTEAGDKKRWAWEFGEIAEIINEPYMPPWVDMVSRFSISTFDSYDEIYRWWWKLAKDKMDSTKQMKAMVKKLTKGKKTVIEKAREVYHWCAAKIRYVGVEYGDAGFEPHLASEIFDNKYGDCKDQSILLIAMLKIAGIKAHPVLIGTRGHWKLDKKFPALAFNHCIVLAEVEGNEVFMDPTAETTSFGDLPSSDQDREVLVIYNKAGSILKTPLYSVEHNRIHKKMKIVISEDETITGTREVFTYGKYDQGQRYWVKYTKPVEFKDRLKSKVNGITPGGELLKYSVSDAGNLNNPIKLRMEFKGPEFLLEAQDDRIVPQLGGLSAEFVSRTERNYPLEFSFIDKLHTEIEISIPNNMKLKYIPEMIIKSTPWFDYTNKYTYSNNVIKFEEVLSRKKKLVTISDYNRYKEVYEELARETSKQAILSLKK